MQRAGDRHKNYKKGIDTDETRRHREQTTIMIRKEKKDAQVNQRRRMAPAGGLTDDSPSFQPTSGSLAYVRVYFDCVYSLMSFLCVA